MSKRSEFLNTDYSVTGRLGAERLIAQRRVYHKRKSICENNRDVENVTMWYVSKIVATVIDPHPGSLYTMRGGGLATRIYTSLDLTALHPSWKVCREYSSILVSGMANNLDDTP